MKRLEEIQREGRNEEALGSSDDFNERIQRVLALPVNGRGEGA